MSIDPQALIKDKSPDELRTSFTKLDKEPAFIMWRDMVRAQRDRALSLVCMSADQSEATLRAAVATLATFETILNMPEILIRAAEQEAAMKQYQTETENEDVQ